MSKHATNRMLIAVKIRSKLIDNSMSERKSKEQRISDDITKFNSN